MKIAVGVLMLIGLISASQNDVLGLRQLCEEEYGCRCKESKFDRESAICRRGERCLNPKSYPDCFYVLKDDERCDDEKGCRCEGSQKEYADHFLCPKDTHCHNEENPFCFKFVADFVVCEWDKCKATSDSTVILVRGQSPFPREGKTVAAKMLEDGETCLPEYSPCECFAGAGAEELAKVVVVPVGSTCLKGKDKNVAEAGVRVGPKQLCPKSATAGCKCLADPTSTGDIAKAIDIKAEEFCVYSAAKPDTLIALSVEAGFMETGEKDDEKVCAWKSNTGNEGYAYALPKDVDCYPLPEAAALGPVSEAYKLCERPGGCPCEARYGHVICKENEYCLADKEGYEVCQGSGETPSSVCQYDQCLCSNGITVMFCQKEQACYISAGSEVECLTPIGSGFECTEPPCLCISPNTEDFDAGDAVFCQKNESCSLSNEMPECEGLAYRKQNRKEILMQKNVVRI